jgi:hypothetical protein
MSPKTSLKKYLSALPKEQLIDQIIDLNKQFRSVQEYYEFFLEGEEGIVLQKYKAVINEEFFPTSGSPKKRLSVIRKVIGNAASLNISPAAFADLMLFYVETGVRFIRECGDLDEAFYKSMEHVFLMALKGMNKAKILPSYRVRCAKIVESSSAFGWGFHEVLGRYYNEYDQ